MRLLKLVRDGIPRMFGDVEIVYEPIPHDERMRELRKKLIEESYEFRDDPTIDELADVYEVFKTLCRDDVGCTLDEVAEVARLKRVERGGFNFGVGMYLRKRS